MKTPTGSSRTALNMIIPDLCGPVPNRKDRIVEVKSSMDRDSFRFPWFGLVTRILEFIKYKLWPGSSHLHRRVFKVSFGGSLWDLSSQVEAPSLPPPNTLRSHSCTVRSNSGLKRVWKTLFARLNHHWIAFLRRMQTTAYTGCQFLTALKLQSPIATFLSHHKVSLTVSVLVMQSCLSSNLKLSDCINSEELRPPAWAGKLHCNFLRARSSSAQLGGSHGALEKCTRLREDPSLHQLSIVEGVWVFTLEGRTE